MRIVQYTNKENTREGVTFTDDLVTDAADFVPYGCHLVSDEECDIELPAGFPMEHQLERVDI